MRETVQTNDGGQIVHKQYENGVTYAIYVPPGVNENTPIFTYVHGSGGPADWRQPYAALQENGANSVVILPTMPWSSDWGDKTMNIVESVKQEYGITNTNVSAGGFSMGGGMGIVTVAENLRRNGANKMEPQVVYLVDDYSAISYKSAQAFTDENIQLFKENNTMFFVYESNHKDRTAINRIAQKGVNVIQVLCENGDHVGIHKDFFTNGIYDYMSGKQLPSEKYKYRKYNAETGEWEDISYDQIKTLYDLYNTYEIDMFKVSLKNLSNLPNIDLPVSSENDVLEAHLNEIRGAIRGTKFLQGNFTEGGFSSTTKVPSKLPSIVTQLITSNVALLEKIAEETMQFAKIGTSIVELDQQTSQEVENMADTLTGVGTGAVLGNTLANQTTGTNDTTTQTNQVTPPNNSTSTSTNTNSQQTNTSSQSSNNSSNNQQSNNSNSNSNSNSSNNQQSNNSSSNNNSNSSSNHNSNSNNNNNNNSNNNNNQQEPQKGGIETFHDYDKLVSDDTKIVYNCNDEYKVIIHKDGDKVTGIEYYYDYGTEQAATTALETLNNNYKTVEHFDKLSQSDRYVKVLFKEDMFKGLSLAQVKEKFVNLQEITKL